MEPGGRRRGSEEQAESELGADEDGDGDPGQTKTVAGEGTGTQTETGINVYARTGTETENSLEANRCLERLGANTGVATVQTRKHNWTQKGFCTGGNGVCLTMCRCC